MKQGSETDSRCAESEKEGRTEGACICIPDYICVLNIKGGTIMNHEELKRHNHLKINAETLNNVVCWQVQEAIEGKKIENEGGVREVEGFWLES